MTFTADDILAHSAARRLSFARNAATALQALGWRVVHAVAHSGGTADLAADRAWLRGRLSARVRLVIRCDARDERLFFSALENGTDRLTSYSFGDDEPAQRRAIAALFDQALAKELHATAYPREAALTQPAQLDAPRARTRAAAIGDAVLDEAFASIDAIRNDLLQHDLDVIRDDFDIDRDFATQAALDAAHRCELLYPIVITGAELWSLSETRAHDWLRVERASLVGHERQWIDVVRAEAFESYADALTRHINAKYRARRFAPAGASSRS